MALPTSSLVTAPPALLLLAPPPQPVVVAWLRLATGAAAVAGREGTGRSWDSCLPTWRCSLARLLLNCWQLRCRPAASCGQGSAAAAVAAWPLGPAAASSRGSAGNLITSAAIQSVCRIL